MKKTLMLGILLTGLFFKDSFSQQFATVVTFRKDIDSIRYKSSVTWVAPTYLFFTIHKFSPDGGKTFQQAGLLGGNVRPFVLNLPEAKKDLNTYRALRIAGIVQMWVAAPFFLIRQINKSNDEVSKGGNFSAPTDLFLSLGFMYSGAITYHFVSKPYLRKSLRGLY